MVFSVLVFFVYQHDWFTLRSTSPDVTIHSGNGFDAWLQYITGYLIEKALSLDNIFVMAMLFSYFKIPGKYQHEVLFWGILGALVFRGVMIVLGATLVNRFAIWFLVSFVMVAFADLLTEITFLGFPFHYFMGAIGALFTFIVIVESYSSIC